MKVSTLTVGVGGAYFVCAGMTVPRRTNKFTVPRFFYLPALGTESRNKRQAMINTISDTFTSSKPKPCFNKLSVKNKGINTVNEKLL